MQGWYTVHDYENNQMGFVAHTDSTKARPLCTTVEACKFTTEQNNDTGIGNAAPTQGEVSDVPEWMLITIGFSAASVIGIMLVCYLLCPRLMRSNRKNTYVLNHHEGVQHLKASRKSAESLESDGLNL